MSAPVKITPRPEEWDELVSRLSKELQEKVRRCEEQCNEVYVTVNAHSTTGPVISIYKPRG